jgi:hypothetical protein
MVESTNLRKVLYNSAFRMCIQNLIIIINCIIDAEMRWYLADEFEDIYFN